MIALGLVRKWAECCTGQVFLGFERCIRAARRVASQRRRSAGMQPWQDCLFHTTGTHHHHGSSAPQKISKEVALASAAGQTPSGSRLVIARREWRETVEAGGCATYCHGARSPRFGWMQNMARSVPWEYGKFWNETRVLLVALLSGQLTCWCSTCSHAHLHNSRFFSHHWLRLIVLLLFFWVSKLGCCCLH